MTISFCNVCHRRTIDIKDDQCIYCAECKAPKRDNPDWKKGEKG